ncbi:hypothetical protein GBAR_LOCUS16287 [Geodia barretti]|uniref:Uncharacterized protein n=1 Tax=Geodia barretti TaxID=519541 RepID=A0AA35SG95_GEOBA|nr:hypothetical protein GBAR_LOCUS16287 [Geodia barretti]
MYEHLIDRSPFDFMMNDLNLGLGSALYDAMGKYPGGAGLQVAGGEGSRHDDGGSVDEAVSGGRVRSRSATFA